MKELTFLSACAVWISILYLNANTIIEPFSALTTGQVAGLSPKATIPDETQDLALLNVQLVQNSNSISPYKIKRYIDEHRDDEYISLEEYWNRLGIPIEEWKKYGKCEASLFELDLDREEGQEVMLRLYDHSGWSMGGTRYLIFKPSTANNRKAWTLLGYIDLEDQRYSLPEHRVISSGKHHWLVLTALAGRGSGYGLYHDQWYQVTRSGLKEVLDYPSSKFLSWREPIPILEARSRIIGAVAESSSMKVKLEFTAAYVLYENGKADQRKIIWEKEQRVTFIRQSEREEFKFSEQESEMSQEEFNIIYDGEGPSNSQILRYNFGDLEKIAMSKDEKKREWLRSYLKDCNEATEKEKLLRSLAQ